ncbi:Thiamin biosynthesis lipoprotein ApbE [Methylophaga thiooxydans]|uniref:FAD:protein FMN transferase n=1 Tax=Methylophaga thiooxydans TaxID=392484 RepID=A0A0A0BLW1_9GAMM|nr:FAD:protein FMN transferase [Methylophaga thiooxydans]KGM08074.1 Thiamin biosynthesis lipoprotein ApbE [Methylophaga thiooxydans]
MKRLPILIVLFSLISACGDSERARQAKFFAFGTEIDVSLYGVDNQTAENTVDALEAAFNNVNNTWHAWQPSTLTRINDAIASGEPIQVEADVAAVITQAAEYAQDSQHLFNPAAGKLFEVWGYHQDNWFESRPPPSQESIDIWLHAAPTMQAIRIEDGTLTSDNKMVKLGFGGFAKGTAVDAAINALKQLDIENAIINIGGDLRAIGSHGDRPWRIGIRHPRKEGGMMASVAIDHDQSVFTSGDYERYFTYEGKRYPHIIDPRTGYPATETISVTVIHQQAARADAAATALVVAGAEWPQIAASMGIDHVMLMRADGQIEMTPAMAEQVRLIDPSQQPLIRQITTP